VEGKGGGDTCQSCGSKLVCMHCALLRRVDGFFSSLPIAKMGLDLLAETERLAELDRERAKKDPVARKAIASLQERFNRILLDPPWKEWVQRKDAALVDLNLRLDAAEHALAERERQMAEMREQIVTLEAAMQSRTRADAVRAREQVTRREAHLREKLQSSEKDREKVQARLLSCECKAQLRVAALTERHARQVIMQRESDTRLEMMQSLVSELFRRVDHSAPGLSPMFGSMMFSDTSCASPDSDIGGMLSPNHLAAFIAQNQSVLNPPVQGSVYRGIPDASAVGGTRLGIISPVAMAQSSSTALFPPLPHLTSV